MSPTVDITSSQNRLVVAATKLHRKKGRRARESFLVETPHVLELALSAGAQIAELFVTPDGEERFGELVRRSSDSGAVIYRVDISVMATLTQAIEPQGIVAVVGMFDSSLTDVVSNDPLVVIDGLADPGNVGTILRTSHAAGAAGVVLASGSVDLYNDKAVRSSAGALFQLPIATNVDRAELIDSIRTGGMKIVGAIAGAGVDFRSANLRAPLAVVIGNEASGISADLATAVDEWVSIPMAVGSESLNAATAAALMLYEIQFQRADDNEFNSLRGADPEGMARLVSAANHDLRSPLTAVRGLATTVSRRWDALNEVTKREMIGQIAEGGERLSRSISDLVDVARLNLGEIRPGAVRVDTAALVKRIVDAARTRFPEAAIEIHASGTATAAYADPDRTEQILNTMVENAIRHGSGVTLVEETGEEDEVKIAVRDNGAGLSESELELVFSGDVELRERRGQPFAIGLALNVARRLARLQGGDLSATSELGAGSTFALTLPAATPTPPKNAHHGDI